MELEGQLGMCGELEETGVWGELRASGDSEAWGQLGGDCEELGLEGTGGNWGLKRLCETDLKEIEHNWDRGKLENEGKLGQGRD